MGGSHSETATPSPDTAIFISQMNNKSTVKRSTSDHSTSPVSWATDKAGSLSIQSIYALSGATAGVVSGLVVCPLDVVKTRLQAQGGFTKYGIISTHHYDGLLGTIIFLKICKVLCKLIIIAAGTIRTIWQTEGVKGFYRGVVPITFGYLPTWMVYFTVYERCKKELPKQTGTLITSSFDWIEVLFLACLMTRF